MSDEAGRFTAEHTVMDKDLEIRELKHLLEVKDNKIKELEEEIGLSIGWSLLILEKEEMVHLLNS